MLKWTKRKLHISPGFIKVDLEAKAEIVIRFFSPAIGPSAEIGIETEEIIIVETIIGLTIGTGLEIIIDVMIRGIAISLMKDGPIIDQTIGEKISDKKIEIDKIIEEMTPDKDTGIGVRAEIDQEIIIVTVLEVEIEIEMGRCNKEPELCQMTEKDLDLGPIPGQVLIETD